jgi:hypothetical protein
VLDLNVGGILYTTSRETLAKVIELTLKGIVQPFELGGETRIIPSAVKYWKPGKLAENFKTGFTQ